MHILASLPAKIDLTICPICPTSTRSNKQWNHHSTLNEMIDAFLVDIYLSAIGRRLTLPYNGAYKIFTHMVKHHTYESFYYFWNIQKLCLNKWIGFDLLRMSLPGTLLLPRFSTQCCSMASFRYCWIPRKHLFMKSYIGLGVFTIDGPAIDWLLLVQVAETSVYSYEQFGTSIWTFVCLLCTVLRHWFRQLNVHKSRYRSSFW